MGRQPRAATAHYPGRGKIMSKLKLLGPTKEFVPICAMPGCDWNVDLLWNEQEKAFGFSFYCEDHADSPAMGIYQVSGNISCWQACPCENCSGHWKTHEINVQVIAPDEQKAGDIAARNCLDEVNGAGAEYDWAGDEDPEVHLVREAAEDIILKQAGYATLLL